MNWERAMKMNPELIKKTKCEKFKRGLVMWNCAVFVCLIVLLLYAGHAHAECGLSDERIAAYTERMAGVSEMILTTLRDHNVDERFIWLAAVESGGRFDAESDAGAVGLWQLTGATSTHYGCPANKRKEPKCSTLAAVRYIRKLSLRFSSNWDIIVAYNMGGSNYRRLGKPTNEARNLANIVTCLMENVEWIKRE
jgi:hypothetical protein